MRSVTARKFFILVLAAGAAACGCGHIPGFGGARSGAAAGAGVKVSVADVGFDDATGANFVLLRDKSGRRELPIVIGENEAQAIMLAMHGVKTDRPLTHDLLESILARTGNKIDRVEIADVRDDVYYAHIYLDRGRYDIDSRPSDAIALAMGTHAPIYVNARLFPPAPGAKRPSGKVPAAAHAAGMTVEELTPELADWFGADAKRGIVVSDAGPAAAAAGIARGDVITQANGHPIAGPADFVRRAAAKKGAAPLVLTVRRGAAERIVTLPAAAITKSPSK